MKYLVILLLVATTPYSAQAEESSLEVCSVDLVFEDHLYGKGGSNVVGVPMSEAWVEVSAVDEDDAKPSSEFKVSVSSSYESGLVIGLFLKRYLYRYSISKFDGLKAESIFGRYCGSQLGLNIVVGAKKVNLKNEHGVRISYILPSAGLELDLSKVCLDIQPREPLSEIESKTVLKEQSCADQDGPLL